MTGLEKMCLLGCLYVVGAFYVAIKNTEIVEDATYKLERQEYLKELRDEQEKKWARVFKTLENFEG